MNLDQENKFIGTGLIAVALLLSSCAAPTSQQTSPTPVITTGDEDAQRSGLDKKSHSGLGPTDVFQVKVFEQADLSGSHRVSQVGTIDFPLIGTLNVASKSVEDCCYLFMIQNSSDHA